MLGEIMSSLKTGFRFSLTTLVLLLVCLELMGSIIGIHNCTCHEVCT